MAAIAQSGLLYGLYIDMCEGECKTRFVSV